MLQKNNRLAGSNAVRRAYRYGHGAKTKNFSIKVIDSHHVSPRIAVVVSKKVDKKAVVRNKIRRNIMEAVRQNILKKTKGNIDIVIFAHNRGIATMKSLDLVLELHQLFKEADTLT